MKGGGGTDEGTDDETGVALSTLFTSRELSDAVDLCLWRWKSLEGPRQTRKSVVGGQTPAGKTAL